MAEQLNVGDVVATLRAETTGFQQAMAGASQRLQQLGQQAQQTQQQFSQLSFQALTTAMQQFAQATTAAWTSQTAFRAASTQAQAALQHFGVTTTGTSAMVSALGTQLATALTQLQGFSAGLQSAQAAMTALQRTGQTAGSSIAGFGSGLRAAFSVAGGLGIATSISGLVSSMVEFGKSVVTVGAQFQQLRASLTAVAGGVQQGGQAFQFITDTANKYGLSLTTLAANYRSLTAATRGTALEGADTQKLLTTLAAASRTFGLSSEQTGHALLAFQQIISKGKVSQEELRQQLSEALPGAMQIAARAFGMTTAELDKFIEKGADSVEFVRKFTAQLSSELPRGTGAVETAAQAFQRLGNEIGLLKDRIASSGILKFFQDLASGAATALKGSREGAEQAQRFLETRAKQAMGTTQALPADAEKLLKVTEQLTVAEERLRDAIIARDLASQGAAGRPSWVPAVGLAIEQRQVTQAQAQVDALRSEQTALAGLLKAREAARQGVTARLDFEGTDALTAQRQTEADAAAANAKLQALLKTTGTELETLQKKAKLTPEAFGNLTGTADQKIEFLTNKIKVLRENLEAFTEEAVRRPNALGALPADVQTQQTALRAQLQAAEKQKEAIQEAVKEAERLAREQERAATRAEAQAERARLAAEREAEHAKLAVPQIQTLLGRVDTETARPGQDTAERARAQVLQQGLTLTDTVTKTLEEIRQHPAIQALAPDLVAQLQARLAIIPEAFATQAQIAFDKVDTQTGDRLTKLGDEASQIGMKLGAAGFSPLEADLARITRQFEEWRTQLLAVKQTLSELRLTATPARQGEIDTQQQTIDRLLPQVQPKLQEALTERQDRAGNQAVQQLRDRLEQLQVPKDRSLFDMLSGTPSRQDLKIQQKADRALDTAAQREEAATIRAAITAQEKLNALLGLSDQLASTAAQAWMTGLQGIIAGTQSVATAFKAMAASILQSLGQIAAQESFRALFRLGVGLVAGALTTPTPGTSATGAAANQTAFEQGAASLFAGSFAPRASGGMVNTPTRILAGESAATNPEWIVNHPQMQSLLAAAVSSAPSAGGQAVGGNVTIVNVATPQQAEAEAAKARARGDQVIMNTIMRDVQRGESSQLVRTLRTLQR